jgi:hypothetical protein
MKNNDCKISINRVGRDVIFIQIDDDKSCQSVCKLEMSLKDFGLAVTGMGYIDCSVELLNVEHFNKERETLRVSAKIPKDTHYNERKEKAYLACKEVTPAGYEIDKSFNSQGSFEFEGDELICSTNAHRWVV